ncbi:MAG TPA: hypothetical protein VG651_18190 [Stellaceae bacterium]|nr:hypothetical protein [Stellaceae bacterium]
MGVAIDAEADAGDGDVDARTPQGFFDIGDEPVELDRTLQQAPDPDDDRQDEDGGEPAEPYQQTMAVMGDMLRRRSRRATAALRRRQRQRLGAGLTAARARATVAVVAGTAR